MKELKTKKGITLVALVVTIIVLLILAGVSINLIMGNEGIIGKSETAVKEHEKATATETINFKITNVQIDTYAKEQRMPTLKELAEFLAEDEEIDYIYHSSKPQASLDWWGADDNYDSIFTILKDYPSYEFEINSSLQLASINGVNVETSGKNDSFLESNNINEFEPIITATGNKLNIKANSISNGSSIMGYIYVIDNKVKKVTSEDEINMALDFNTDYNVYVTAIDEDNRLKNSKIKNVKTEDALPYIKEIGKTVTDGDYFECIPDILTSNTSVSYVTVSCSNKLYDITDAYRAFQNKDYVRMGKHYFRRLVTSLL